MPDHTLRRNKAPTMRAHLYQAALDIVVAENGTLLPNADTYIEQFAEEYSITKPLAAYYIHTAFSEVLSHDVQCRVDLQRSTQFCIALDFGLGKTAYLSLPAMLEVVSQQQKSQPQILLPAPGNAKEDTEADTEADPKASSKASRKTDTQKAGGQG